MADDPHLDPQADCFRPPAIPTEVHCLHCGGEYESYLIEWREEVRDGRRMGFWRCPTPGCGGAGFGFDLLPTDPDYIGEDGQPMWCFDDDEEEEDEDEDYDDDLDLLGPAAPPDDPPDPDADDDDIPW